MPNELYVLWNGPDADKLKVGKTANFWARSTANPERAGSVRVKIAELKNLGADCFEILGFVNPGKRQTACKVSHQPNCREWGDEFDCGLMSEPDEKWGGQERICRYKIKTITASPSNENQYTMRLHSI